MKVRRKPKESALRIFFATDIHGSEQCFRKWLHAKRVYEVDLLVLGGDLSGKTIVPIVVDDTGDWEVNVTGRSEHGAAAALDELRKRIRSTGGYDLVLSADEKRRLDGDPRSIEAAFVRAMHDTVTRWVSLMDERMDAGSCYVMLGNDDPPDLADPLRASRAATYAEDAVVSLPMGYELVSFGYSTPTPWDTPRELAEDEFLTRLERLVGSLTDPSRAIFNFHCPPKDTALDQAPRLSDDLTPSSVETTSVGSQAVREVIERYQPVLGLHGHVHECSAGVRIGRTVCVNPGSDYASGVLRGVIAELQGDHKVRWQLTQG